MLFKKYKNNPFFLIFLLLFFFHLYFNGRVGRSAQLDDVVSMFGENTCNASGNRLLSFLNEVELMICNGRKLVSELSGQGLGLA